jgi:hypothetical protein
MQNLWQQWRRLTGAAQRNSITVVSGLPRSGTSLMMGMLAAGGLPLLTDELRRPDEDNPQGYYEFERVKRLEKGDVGWLAGAGGKAVKVISALLPYLPPGYSYRVIFMERPLGEILSSQRKMLARRQPGEVDRGEDAEMATVLGRHLEETRRWLTGQPHMATLYLPYHELVNTPHRHVEQIRQFLGATLDTTAMVQTVEPALYRNRTDA